MEWLLKKALENPSESYSPEAVARMLNSHAEAINQNAQALDSKINILTLAVLVLIIISQAINLFYGWRFNKRLKKLEI